MVLSSFQNVSRIFQINSSCGPCRGVSGSLRRIRLAEQIDACHQIENAQEISAVHGRVGGRSVSAIHQPQGENEAIQQINSESHDQQNTNQPILLLKATISMTMP